MNKIYIIGPVGSGKSTLAKALSKKLNIKYYELDMVIWDENERKRTDEEIKEIFDGIMSQDSWIIEDVGRNKFKEGRELADKIYYIKLPRSEVNKRVIIRWIKQKTGKMPYNYPPTIKSLLEMLKWVRQYSEKEKIILKELEEYKDKLRIIDINNIKEEK